MVESEKGKPKLMVESEKGKAKLMVSDEMVEYVLAKYGKNRNVEDEIADVILEDLQIKYGKEDFSRLLKAKKAKEAKEADEAKLKVNKELVQVSSDEGFSVMNMLFALMMLKPLTDAEIRMFKERPTTSKAPTRQLASTSTRSRALVASTSTFKASTRSRAPIASTSNAQAASTSAQLYDCTGE
ncbi:hypothetical protein Tco_1319434 [Tanacetum coccineum]